MQGRAWSGCSWKPSQAIWVVTRCATYSLISAWSSPSLVCTRSTLLTTKNSRWLSRATSCGLMSCVHQSATNQLLHSHPHHAGTPKYLPPQRTWCISDTTPHACCCCGQQYDMQEAVTSSRMGSGLRKP